MNKAIVLALILAACLAGTAAAEVPSLLNYQGILTDGSGVAVPDNTYGITFKIYEVPSGGSALWTEIDNVVVSKGTFSVTLGTVSPLNSLAFNTTYYLGMTVADDPELPRQILTSSPYCLNAKTVRGGENIFPADGMVGIGTLIPSVPLQVTNTSGQVGIEFDGNDDYYASIYVNGVKPGAASGYGYETQGTLRAFTGVNAANQWYLTLANYALRATQAGNVSIGATAPSTERLRVDGGIQLGNALGTNAGTIRWSGSDFEGYNGSTWQSLTATGGGGPPAGTTGQTLRYNGSDWVGTSNLFNDGTNIGIGTTAPTSHLNLEGSVGTEELLVNQTSATGDATLRLKTNGGAYDHLMLEKFAPSASGTVAGIALADIALIDAGINGGALMHRVASSNPMYFLTNNLERMRLTADGKLGINVTAPTATLHVGGDVAVGTTSNGGTLNVYGSGMANPVDVVGSNAYGGIIQLFDEGGSTTGLMEADFNGTGGYLAIQRGVGIPGFTVDGNYANTGDTRVAISGADRWAEFNMNATGDACVNLPLDAISSFEILDEPGMTNYVNYLGSALTTTLSPVASQSITAPAAGYVIVTGTTTAYINQTNGTVTQFIMGVSTSSSTLPVSQSNELYFPAVMPTGAYYFPVSMTAVFQVSAGVNTFYLDARALSGAGSLFNRSITLLYVPTAYGSFVAPLTASGETDLKGAPTGGPLTPSETAATTAASEAANADRVQKELDAMKDRVAKLEAEMRSSQGNR
ncbi:MAG: hypothetical protein ABR899_08430 [Candidatus Krumholzibacteriaceae bacterium]|jgi:hypothetical protein